MTRRASASADEVLAAGANGTQLGAVNQDAATRVVGAAIVDNAEVPTRLLVAQRSYPDSLRGLWEFPGGKQEPGEGAHQALVRECREELGVDVVLDREILAPTPDGWPLKGSAVIRVFTATVPGQEEPVAGEYHLLLRWVSLDDPSAVAELDWIPADLPIVRALLSELGVASADG